MRRLTGLFIALALAFPAPATAAFHLMKIVEFYPGAASAPNTQYVVLQMYAAGQTVLTGHSVTVYDANNTAVATASFTASASNGANQAKVLIGTASVATDFGVTPDLVIPAGLVASGGKICFDAIDCVTFGSSTDTSVGSPFAPSGLELGRAVKRRLDIAGGATTLEGSDDTDDSANDFVYGAPTPTNNAGVVGGCGNGVVGIGEACDDGNAFNSDECLNSCQSATCGDGFVYSGMEQCDDANGSNTDGCLTTCRSATCGDGFLRAGTEQCDDANTSNTDACLATCVPASCGDGFVEAGVEDCDDANAVDTDACLSTCDAASCGDGFVHLNSENCDDGANNGMAGMCNATCTGETGTDCGNGVVEGSEACDTSGMSATCDGDCTAVVCGDGRINAAAGETCDLGASNGMPNMCSTTCNGLTPSVCGNAIVEAGETCDAGANNGMPAMCSATCNGITAAVCGNSVIEAGETCDAGADNGEPNLCDADCNGVTPSACGNAVTEAGEACDLGGDNGVVASGCADDCTVEVVDERGHGGGGCQTTSPASGGAPAALAGLVSTFIARRRRRR